MDATARTAVLVLMLTTAWVTGVQADEQDKGEESEVPCDPYPIGRCGEYQRESVIFCFVIVDGLYVSATDDEATGLVDLTGNTGDETGLPPVDDARYYLRTGPAEAFVDDPFNAPLPFGTFYEETNFVEGLQPTDFKCGKWVWFAECVPQQWMGPTGVFSQPADQLYV